MTTLADMITPRQAFDLLGGAVPLKTIYYYIYQRKLKCKKTFGRWRISRAHLEKVFGAQDGTGEKKPARRAAGAAGGAKKKRFQRWPLDSM
jgi:hypothetical protein